MNLLKQIEDEQVAKLTAGKEIPEFQPGDTVIVNVKIVEGERSRVQAYEGVCIGRAGAGLNENFTVRKISYGEGVERVFPLYSPMIELDQGRAPRPGAPRQALLSARTARQVGAYRRAAGSQRSRTGRGRQQKSRESSEVIAPSFWRLGDARSVLQGRLGHHPGRPFPCCSQVGMRRRRRLQSRSFPCALKALKDGFETI